MAQETKPLPYKEFVDHIDEHLAALDEPATEVTFEKDGRIFHVYGEQLPRKDVWVGYNAERLRETIAKHRYNALEGLDTEAFKRYLRESRSQDSEGRPG